jgi:hypothetical protein
MKVCGLQSGYEVLGHRSDGVGGVFGYCLSGEYETDELEVLNVLDRALLTP